MCGILGSISPTPHSVDLASISAGLAKIRHRGPDGEGVLIWGSTQGARNCSTPDTPPGLELTPLEHIQNADAQVVLGHRRLSIIDLSSLGHQPMSYDSGRFWLTFNGEIYNFIEIREELKALGHPFVSGADTEVVLAAYKEWGVESISRFIGMFAFALLDTSRETVLLARDHFGIKPLYYSVAGNQLVFGSEIPSILEFKQVSRRANPQAIYDYLRFGLTDHGTSTFFADIHQLQAAHYSMIDLKQPTVVKHERYWHPKIGKPVEIGFNEACVHLRNLLADSVALHMRSDVPVGSCLSGGLDSTAIVGLMQESNGGNSIPTFTYVADDAILSEAKYVDIAEKSFKLDGHRIGLSADEASAAMSTIISSQAAPFGGFSMLAQHKVFDLAHQHGMKVLLDGQGSDEMFGGYVTMLGARATGLLAQGKFGQVKSLLDAFPANMSGYKKQTALMALGRLVPRWLEPLLLTMTGNSLYSEWMRQDYFEKKGVTAQQRPVGRGKDALRQELLISLEEISLPRLLRYEDRNSMFFSIESRVPFCNHRLAEFALSLPPEYLVSDKGETKYVLREAMRGLVPDAIIDREKVGFAVPERKLASSMREWLAGLVEILEDLNLPFINMEVLKEKLDAHLNHSGQHELNQYWRPLNIAIWAKEFQVEF